MKQILLVVLAVLLLLASSIEAFPCSNPEEDCDRCGPKDNRQYGQVLGSYGVDARSNGGCTGKSTGHWQCVEYVKRFYSVIYNLTLGSPGGQDGSAFNYYNLYGSGNQLQQLGFTRYTNGETNVLPQKDDLLVFDGGGYGHVAIITSVNTSTNKVGIIEQNWSASAATRSLTMTNVGGKYSISSGSNNYSTLGWLRVNVGRYTDGWHDSFCPSSQPFLDAYLRNGGYSVIGSPYSSGAGSLVHLWWNVWLQEFYHPVTMQESAIMLNSTTDQAYYLSPKMWQTYNRKPFSPTALGAPKGEEYACLASRCQDFEHGTLDYSPSYNDAIADFNDGYWQHIATVQDQGTVTEGIPSYTLPCRYAWYISNAEKPNFYAGQVWNGGANVCAAQGWQTFGAGDLSHCCSQGELTRDNNNCIIAARTAFAGNRYSSQLTNYENYPLRITAGKTYLFSMMVRNDSPASIRTITVALTPRSTYDTFNPIYSLTDVLAAPVDFTVNNTWQQLSYHFIATRTDTKAALRIFYGDQKGAIRMDDIYLNEVLQQ